MEKSTVYFTDFRCPVGTSQLVKLKKLCVAAGIKDTVWMENCSNQDAFWNELGNLAFLRRTMRKLLLICVKNREECRF